MRVYRQAHPDQQDERHRARRRMGMRKTRGRIAPPPACTSCGAARRLEMHHPDYGQPTDVAWLCRACHLAEHGKAPAPGQEAS